MGRPYDPDSAYALERDRRAPGAGQDPLDDPGAVQSALTGFPTPEETRTGLEPVLEELDNLDSALAELADCLARWVTLANRMELLAVRVASTRRALEGLNRG